MAKPAVSYFDRNTVAVVDQNHQLLTPKQARTLGFELIEAADRADVMTQGQVMAMYDDEQARLREEFPEQYTRLSELDLPRATVTLMLDKLPPETEMRVSNIMAHGAATGSRVILTRGDGLYELGEHDWQAVLVALENTQESLQDFIARKA